MKQKVVFMSCQIWSYFQNVGPSYQGICCVMEGCRTATGFWEHWALMHLCHHSSGINGDSRPLPVNDWDPFLQGVLLL